MEAVTRNDYFSARLSCRSDLSIPGKIKERLNEDIYEMFKKSCFGVFDGMTDLVFQGQLYLHLLFKQERALAGDKLIFHVNQCVAEFGPNEFTLVTGLKFGPKRVIPERSSFYGDVFDTELELMVRDIEEAFMDATDEEATCEPEIGLKLALLWILYEILLKKDNTSKKIDEQYIHLMDDYKVFNNFPWGRVAYEFLVEDIRSRVNRTATARRRKNKLGKKGDTNPQLDLHIFAYAIQFWAYEVMPCVAKLCATRKRGSLIPIMLRWESENFYRFKALTHKCFPVLRYGDEVAEWYKVLKNMEASPLERRTDYYKVLVEWEKNYKTSSSKQRKRSRADFDNDIDQSPLKRINQTMKATKECTPLKGSLAKGAPSKASPSKRPPPKGA